MIYTSYFANIRNLPGSVVPISIAARAPAGYSGPEYRKLIPPYNVFSSYKAGGSWEDYESGYKAEVLDSLDPDETVKELMKLADGLDDIALVCYEKPGDNCHRNIVADWLRDAGYEVSEYASKKKRRKNKNHGKVYINADGERVMRITEILKVLAKDQLITWANMLGFKKIDYKKELERTANIGSMAHDLIENYTTPGKISVFDYDGFDIETREDQMEVTNAWHSFLAWYENLSVPYNIKFTEKTVVGKKYGGTIDCGIDGFEDPDKAIFVDYKTSSGFYLSQFLQLSGYVRIYEELYGEKSVEGVMVVLCDKNNGDPARAMYIEREHLEMLLITFDQLYNTALMTKMVNGMWRQLGVPIA